jgi:hypothetical protein
VAGRRGKCAEPRDRWRAVRDRWKPEGCGHAAGPGPRRRPDAGLKILAASLSGVLTTERESRISSPCWGTARGALRGRRDLLLPTHRSWGWVRWRDGRNVQELGTFCPSHGHRLGGQSVWARALTAMWRWTHARRSDRQGLAFPWGITHDRTRTLDRRYPRNTSKGNAGGRSRWVRGSERTAL